MLKIAITGGLSSGKSTVCKIFKDLGAFTISSDDIVHHLLLNHRELQEKIVNLLGSDILTNNLLDREKIAKIVFSHREKLQLLEGIIHPAVFHEIQAIYEKIKTLNTYALFIAEVPLLYETESQNLFDYVVTVLSEEAQCKERFKTMRNKSEAQFDDRMMSQLPLKEKAARSDFVIVNNGSIEDLKIQVERLSSKLRSI